ncbi:MAG: NAD(P)-dependent dehydrogenase (short-subunit alcohol dehydrogenase family) [Psychromonas sp.]|jgi:NAD(P)-dependent dehydrogenase (short-subunit alcohol dehydrogenase family)
MSKQIQRIIVITGGTAGIGYQSAKGLAKKGVKIFITGRNQERGEKAQQSLIAETGNDQIQFVVGNVSSIAGVDSLASLLIEEVDHIDVLINNAGYLGSEFRKNDDDLEMHFAVNVLAPRRFTLALLPLLKVGKNARVLNITGGDKPALIDIDNLQAEKGFKGLMTYTHSKSVMEAMSMALASELEPEGVSVNVIFPGRASTNMTNSLSMKSLPGPLKLMFPIFKFLFREDGGKSATKAAQSTIWGASTPDLDGMTGSYFDTNIKEQKLHSTAYDLKVQERIVSIIKAAQNKKSVDS